MRENREPRSLRPALHSYADVPLPFAPSVKPHHGFAYQGPW